MKKLKKLIYVLIGLVLILFIGLQFLINPILEKAKPILISKISSAIGSEVEIGKLEASVFPSPKFLLENLTIGPKDKGVSLGHASLSISISEALKGIVTLSSVKVSNVKLNATMGTDGSFNIDGLNLKKPESNNKPAVKAEAKSENEEPNSNQEAKAETVKLEIDKINVNDVVLNILNQKTNSTLLVSLNDLALVRESEKGKLDLNLKIGSLGTVSINGGLPTFKLEPNNFKAFNGSLVSKFSSFDEVLTFVGTPKEKAPVSNFNIVLNILLPKIGIKDLQLNFAGNHIKSSGTENELLYSLEPPKGYTINNLLLELASGSIGLKGKGIENSPQAFSVQGQNLDLTELLKFAPNDSTKKAPIQGKLSNLTTDITMDKDSKSGNFSVTLAPFSVLGLNIFKKVSDALEVFPGLGVSLASSLPQAYAAVLLSQNSEFQNIKVDGRLLNSKITLSNLQANSKGYSLNGKGVLNNGEMDLGLSLIISSDLVSAIEKSQPKIATIKNSDGTIVIPLQIKKSADGSPVVLPDIENLMKQQVGIQLKNNAKKALDKVSPGLGGLVDGLLN